MTPSLVVSALEEWILVPTKYRLSNTFPGSVNHVARSGGGGGRTSAPGPVCGAMQMRASVPVKSNPAAALAAARCASIALGAGCAIVIEALVAPTAATT